MQNGKGAGRSKLNGIDASLKVWVGKLPGGATAEDLQAHFEQVGVVALAEPMPRNTACIAFNSAEEAQSAIAVLNGSDFGGSAIEVDVWTTKPSGPKPGMGGFGKGSFGKGKVGMRPMMIQKPMFQKPMGSIYPTMGGMGGGMRPGFGGMAGGKGFGGFGGFGGMAAGFGAGAKGKGKGKKGNPLKQIDNSLKVWVNNVPDLGNKWKGLETHFNQVGTTQWVEIMPKGVACVAYKTAEEASAALSLNGVDFEGVALEVDVWEKAPKKV